MTDAHDRGVPNVFAEPIAADSALQDARRRTGRIWIWLLLLVGILIATLLFVLYAYNNLVREHVQREELQQEITRLRASAEGYRSEYAEMEELRVRAATLRLEIEQIVSERPSLRAIPTPPEAWPRIQDYARQELNEEIQELSEAERRLQITRRRSEPSPNPLQPPD
jgi:hypothetical protein